MEKKKLERKVWIAIKDGQIIVRSNLKEIYKAIQCEQKPSYSAVIQRAVPLEICGWKVRAFFIFSGREWTRLNRYQKRLRKTPKNLKK